MIDNFCFIFFFRKDFELQANNGELLEEIDNSDRTSVASFPLTDESVTFPYKIIVHHKFPFRRDDRTFEEKVTLIIQFRAFITL